MKSIATRLPLALASLLLSSAALAQSSPAGLWKTIDDATQKEKSLVRITESGGSFSGSIEKLLEAPEPGKESICDLCQDERKGKPLTGLQILKNIKRNAQDPKLYDGGEILDPKNGKTYNARLTPSEDGKTLQVRGYLGTPFLGRTQTWTRVE